MLTRKQIKDFGKSGYLLVPNILTVGQVRSLRTALLAKFNTSDVERFPGDSRNYLFDIFSRHRDLRWLLFHEPTLAVLRSLLGEDFVFMREVGAHFQGYYAGWHKDTTAQERAGHMFQWDDDYLMVEVAYYLQDNTPNYGGGLDVQPGSHRQPDYFVRPPAPSGRVQRLFGELIGKLVGNGKRNVVSIPSKVGDLLIFDYRINHRATQPKLQDIPEENQKMAIFIACSRNTPHVKAYHDFIASRESYVYLQGFAYPGDLIADCRRANINLV
jgi:hypothetical protein